MKDFHGAWGNKHQIVWIHRSDFFRFHNRMNNFILTQFTQPRHKFIAAEKASAGFDYAAAVRLGIRVIKAGNLPEMVAYESSGKSISEFVRGKLHC